jgi:hypothetical protein
MTKNSRKDSEYKELSFGEYLGFLEDCKFRMRIPYWYKHTFNNKKIVANLRYFNISNIAKKTKFLSEENRVKYLKKYENLLNNIIKHPFSDVSYIGHNAPNMPVSDFSIEWLGEDWGETWGNKKKLDELTEVEYLDKANVLFLESKINNFDNLDTKEVRSMDFKKLKDLILLAQYVKKLENISPSTMKNDYKSIENSFSLPGLKNLPHDWFYDRKDGGSNRKHRTKRIRF